mmetsp:Transcript_19167/g.42528  ORF Transcript_19167/g.42528 Transcript_19167/m.42528 type:complete len:226 (+) Transcript_19167:116-793(+)
MRSTRSEPVITSMSTVKSSPKWTIGGRSNRDRMDMIPGPGAYGSHPLEKVKYSASPNYQFGTSSRDGPLGAPVPGPGQYSPESVQEHKRAAPRVGFGTSPRQPNGRRPNGPGPAAYDIKDARPSSPKYSVAPRRNAGYGPSTPGPGQYNTSARHSVAEGAPKWGFGTSQRQGLNSNAKTPGPGSYQHAVKIGDGPKFTMSARRIPPSKTTTPGPGTHGGSFTQFS